jgi:hypothetical protein
MAEFYVNSEALSTGNRLVHFSNCEELPAVSGLRYLGSFGSAEAAYTKASGLYPVVDICPVCQQKHG